MIDMENEKIISILGTGGTIASKIDYSTGGVYAAFSPSDIINQIPEIKDIAEIRTKQVMNIMSEDMKPEYWKIIAREAVKELNSGSNGIIITHGTDTMHFTSAALCFMLKNLNGTIALVGAQRSSDRGSSDSFMNMICASHLITKSDIGEILVVMHESMNDDYCIAIRGCRCRKMHTSRRDAFKSINEKPIARISYSGEIEIINKNYIKKREGKVFVDDKLEEKVAFVKVYPGIDPEIFDFYLDKKYKGFVVEATGLGHVPTLGKNSVLNKIKKIRENEIPVVITSQCIYGRVHPTIYANLRKLYKLGVIFAEDMLPEVAYIKLMFILGHTKNEEEIKNLMLKNIAGEISERSE